MDTPKVDISSTLANLRKEESDRKAKNWKSAQDLLRGAATDAIRSKYADQIDWEQGVEYADKVFKVQYERLMAVDPQAAAQLAQEYKVEREKRVNKQVSDAYKRQEEDPELKALEAEIVALGSSIQAEEVESKRQESLRATQEEAMQGYTTVPNPEAFPEANVANIQAQGRAETQMQGYRPEVSGLRSFYGATPAQAQPSQQALPQPMSGVQVPQTGAEVYGMQNYRPLNAWYKGGI
jgi:hypothetical protein